jgi:hypothetical protein
MFRVFSCLADRFVFVGVTCSAAIALTYVLRGSYVVCDATDGCFDADELSRLAAVR